MKKDFNTGFNKSIQADRVNLTGRRKQILRELGFEEDLEATELAEKLHEQTSTVDVLNRSLITMENEKVKLQGEKAQLQDENKRLEEEVKKLQERIKVLEGTGSSLTVAKTSANSSVPPSKNPIGIRHTQSQRVKSGGQKGHEGNTRRQDENVSDVERWYPASVCPICGKSLDMDAAKEGAVRQTVDIPQSVFAYVVNHIQMDVKCSCGHHCKGEFPENVKAPVSYGPNLTALVTYLSTYQAIPFKRLTELLEVMLGLHISQGSVANMLNHMRKLSKKPYEMIRQKVVAGNAAGADETGIDVNGKNSWLWSFQNDVATYLAFDKSRGYEVVAKNFSRKDLAVWYGSQSSSGILHGRCRNGRPLGMYRTSAEKSHIYDAGLSG